MLGPEIHYTPVQCVANPMKSFFSTLKTLCLAIGHSTYWIEEIFRYISRTTRMIFVFFFSSECMKEPKFACNFFLSFWAQNKIDNNEMNRASIVLRYGPAKIDYISCFVRHCSSFLFLVKRINITSSHQGCLRCYNCNQGTTRETENEIEVNFFPSHRRTLIT